MKKIVLHCLTLSSLVLAAFLLMAANGEAHAEEAASEQVESKPAHGDHSGHQAEAEEEIDIRTVVGEVIDITCYVRHASQGPKHAKCALTCANMGMPLGVLEEGTNNIYLIIPPGHEDPKGPVVAFLGQKVTIEAILYSMGGMTSLEVEEIKAIEEN